MPHCCAEVLLLTLCEGLPDHPHLVVLMQTASAPLVLVTGAAGGPQGATGRVLSHLLLARGIRVRALVRTDDDRAASLRAAGAEVRLTTSYKTRRHLTVSLRCGAHALRQSCASLLLVL